MEERYASLDFAGHISTRSPPIQTIELSPDLPAWKYKDQACIPDEELALVLTEARNYLQRFNVVAHSGQQDDSAMAAAELKREQLRDQKRLAAANAH